MAISRVKLSRLPKVDSLKDVSTLGYKKEGNTNMSYQVPLDLVQDATDRANNAAKTIDSKIEARVPSGSAVGTVLTKGASGNEWKSLSDSGEVVTPADLENTIKHLVKHLAPKGKIVLKNGDTLRGLPFSTIPTDIYDFSQMTDATRLFSYMPYLESINEFDFSKVTYGEYIVAYSPKITEFVNHTTGNIKDFYQTFTHSNFKHADFNTSGATSIIALISRNKSLESLALLDATNWKRAVSFILECIKLKDVAGFKNLSCNADFWNCIAITPESMQNIASHAKDMTGLEPITFTFMKVVVNRTPESILQMFTDKNIIIKTY